jgi:hypothetical protein
MDVMLPCLPADDGFVLCPPDFDSQNVIVDAHGNISGFIDWDLAQTMPRYVGYARYPGWITRDWDPLMYGWPMMTEDSPEDLHRYREHYNLELGRALAWQGDFHFTVNSHITEAVWIAATNPANRPAICRKLIQAALGKEDDDALSILYDIGAGDYGEEDWLTLKIKLEQLMD